MEKDIDRYFRTANFALAVFLYSRNHKIAGIQPTSERGQKEFAFVNSPELEELVDLFKFGPKDDEHLLVSVHVHDQARQELLSLLKD